MATYKHETDNLGAIYILSDTFSGSLEINYKRNVIKILNKLVDKLKNRNGRNKDMLHRDEVEFTEENLNNEFKNMLNKTGKYTEIYVFIYGDHLIYGGSYIISYPKYYVKDKKLYEKDCEKSDLYENFLDIFYLIVKYRPIPRYEWVVRDTYIQKKVARIDENRRLLRDRPTYRKSRVKLATTKGEIYKKFPDVFGPIMGDGLSPEGDGETGNEGNS